MLQDLRAGRRTEIDAITGALVELAEPPRRRHAREPQRARAGALPRGARYDTARHARRRSLAPTRRSAGHPRGIGRNPMPIARRLQWYLDAKGVRYDVLPHPHSSSSMETARQAHVPADSARQARAARGRARLRDGDRAGLAPRRPRAAQPAAPPRARAGARARDRRPVPRLRARRDARARQPLPGAHRLRRRAQRPRRSISRQATTRTWCTCTAATSCACSRARCTGASASAL